MRLKARLLNLLDSKRAMQIWLYSGVALCCCLVTVLILRLESVHPNSLSSNVFFFKAGVADKIFWLAGVYSVISFALAVRACLKKQSRRIMLFAFSLSVIVSLLAFPVSWLEHPILGCWFIEDQLIATNGQTFYFLHSPPPMNGGGCSALARRTSGNPFFFTVKILSDSVIYDKARQYVRGRKILPTILSDPHPEARQAAQMLLKQIDEKAPPPPF